MRASKNQAIEKPVDQLSLRKKSKRPAFTGESSASPNETKRERPPHVQEKGDVVPSKEEKRPSNYSQNRAKKVEKEEDLKLFRHKVFLDGLPFDRTDQTDAKLFDLCLEVGAKGAIRLVQKKRYGFGYLVFHTNEQAKRAVARLDGKTLFGRALRVEQPKAPNQEKLDAQAGQSNKSIFDRQILLFNIPRFVNSEVLDDALKDHLRGTPFADSVEDIKNVKREKAFVTFKAEFEERIPRILEDFKANPLKILGTTIDTVRAIPPHQTGGKRPAETILNETSQGDANSTSKRPKSSATELQKLLMLSKSRRSYSFLLQEVGDPSDSKRFRANFCERFDIEDQNDVIELSPVSTSLHKHSTGLWKVIVTKYIIAYQIFAMCSNGREEGNFRIELCE